MLAFLLTVQLVLTDPFYLTSQLGSEEFKEREFAEGLLRQMNSFSVPALKAALTSENVEVRERAGRLLREVAAREKSSKRVDWGAKLDGYFNDTYPCIDALNFDVERRAYLPSCWSPTVTAYLNRTRNSPGATFAYGGSYYSSYRCATRQLSIDMAECGVPLWVIGRLHNVMYKPDLAYMNGGGGVPIGPPPNVVNPPDLPWWVRPLFEK
jgi:hypothetical protein